MIELIPSGRRKERRKAAVRAAPAAHSTHKVIRKFEGIMKFAFAHNNINVLDLDKSVKFYEDNLGLKVVRRVDAEDGGFSIVFLEDENSTQQLELTWLRDKKEPYNLGDNEIHLAFRTDDMAEAHAFHEKQGVIIFENPAIGIYFIGDPDGYWVEIIPER
jgi:lactoylglutathione lyase